MPDAWRRRCTVTCRSTAGADDEGWWHPAPFTFPHQGWLSVNGLTVTAPGLPEAEVTPEGVIAVTLLRAVGWMSHLELTRRPIPAAPTLKTPDAQCPGGVNAQLSMRFGDAEDDVGVTAATATADELGLRAVAAGPGPLAPAGRDLLRIDPPSLVLSALKPAEDGDGVILRVLNPGGSAVEGTVVTGVPVHKAVSVRLDESPDGGALEHQGSRLTLSVGPHGVRSVRLRL